MCNNIITDNTVGLGTSLESQTYLGDQGVGGWNSIFNNIVYNASTIYSSYLSAYCNYFGINPNLSVDGTSTNEVDNILTSDPCSSYNNITLKNTSNNNLNKSCGNNISAGMLLEKQGKIDEAIEYYKKLITKDIYTRAALTNLLIIKNKYSRPEIGDYFESIANSHNKHYGNVKNLIGDIYLQNGNFETAITAFDSVIYNCSNDVDGINARFEKLFAYLNIKNNTTIASQLLSELNGMKLTNEGDLIKINEEMCFSSEVLGKLRDDYKAMLIKDGKATPATFKDLTGLSRKYIIPLMEYFDVNKLTVRVGDHRILREKT